MSLVPHLLHIVHICTYSTWYDVHMQQSSVSSAYFNLSLHIVPHDAWPALWLHLGVEAFYSPLVLISFCLYINKLSGWINFLVILHLMLVRPSRFKYWQAKNLILRTNHPNILYKKTLANTWIAGALNSRSPLQSEVSSYDVLPFHEFYHFCYTKVSTLKFQHQSFNTFRFLILKCIYSGCAWKSWRKSILTEPYLYIVYSLKVKTFPFIVDLLYSNKLHRKV